MASEHELTLLVNVGDNGEASVLRSYLEHHGIHVFVKGENHRSLLGMVGTYIDLGVMVPKSQLEDAQELYAAYQEGHDDVDPPEMRGVHRDQFPDDEDEEDEDEWKTEAEQTRARQRSLLAAFIVPLGGAHYSIGAYASGLLLTGISVYAIVQGLSNPAFLGVWGLAVAMDLIGSRYILQSRAKLQSRARLKSRAKD